MWRGYFGIENIALNDSQRAELIAALRQLGPQSRRRVAQPAYLCHWRTRLDGDAAIFEALFDEENLTVQAFKNRLGAIFDVDPDTIDHSTTVAHFAYGDTPVVTFGRSGTDYLRMALFGGVEAGWVKSRAECLGYLAANIEEWEDA